MNDEIAQLKADKNEAFVKWNALLDNNPVQLFENKITWAENVTTVPEADYHTFPLVSINGLVGTICGAFVDENAYKLICSLIDPGYVPLKDSNRKPHDVIESQIGKYPILLNNIACKENATSWNDCTSHSMGYENCFTTSYSQPVYEGYGLQAFCGPDPSLTS